MTTRLLGFLIEAFEDEEGYETLLDEVTILNVALNWLHNGKPPVNDQQTYDILASVYGDLFEASTLTQSWKPDTPYFRMTPGFRSRMTTLYSGGEEGNTVRPYYHARAEADRGMTPDEYMVYFMRTVFRTYLDKKNNTNGSYVRTVENVFGDIASIKYEDIIADYRRSLPHDYTLIIGDIELNVSLVDLLARYGYIIDIFQLDDDNITSSKVIELPRAIVDAITLRLANIPAIMDKEASEEEYLTYDQIVKLLNDTIIDGKYISDDLERQLQLTAIDSALGNMFGNDEVMDKWKDNDVFRLAYIE